MERKGPGHGGVMSANTGLLSDIRKGRRLKKSKGKAKGTHASTLTPPSGSGTGASSGGRRVSVARVQALSRAEESTILGNLRATMERRRQLVMRR